MIRVIRQDGMEILLNTELIKQIKEDKERRAIIVMEDGEEVHVKVPVWDVTTKMKAFRSTLKQERRDYEKNKGKDPKQIERERAKAQKDSESSEKLEAREYKERERPEKPEGQDGKERSDNRGGRDRGDRGGRGGGRDQRDNRRDRRDSRSRDRDRDSRDSRGSR